jgi:TrmH family RNA methyltransferase
MLRENVLAPRFRSIALVVKKPEPRFEPEPQPPNPLIYLDHISDPGNLGTIIRTALWFGVDAIMLSPESADPFQGKVVRSSAGAITQVRIWESCALPELNLLKERYRFTLIAGTVKGGLPLHNLQNQGNICLLFGSEASGLDDRLLQLSHIQAHIPGTGRIDSLNLAISAACFLYHLNSNTTEVSS